jgi:hypothetical protein
MENAMEAAKSKQQRAQQLADRKKNKHAEDIRAKAIEERAVLQLPFDDKSKQLQALCKQRQEVCSRW